MLKGRKSLGQSPIVFKSGIPVSVICVAATYTGVTYADNGGKVQLSSAGVHGLTTSPAVGSSVYVSWAGGTGVSGLYTVLSVDDALKFTINLAYAVGLGTPTVAVANTEIALASLSIPPLQTGSQIHIAKENWALTASVNLKALIIRLAGTSMRYSNIGSNYNEAHFSTLIANRGISSQVVNNGVTDPGTTSGYTFPSVNTAVPTILLFTTKPVTANEIVRLESYLIEVFI